METDVFKDGVFVCVVCVCVCMGGQGKWPGQSSLARQRSGEGAGDTIPR